MNLVLKEKGQAPAYSKPKGPYAWGYTGPENSAHRYMVIYDRNGRVILSVFGKTEERIKLANAIIEMSRF